MTPQGEGGINIVEIEGPDALRIVEGLFHSPRGMRVSEMDAGQLLYGRLQRGGEIVDEVIVECVAGGTRPALAVNCHGGAVAAARVLDALEAEGAEQTDWAGARVWPSRPRLGALHTRGRVCHTDAVRRGAAERVPSALTFYAFGVLMDQYHGALTEAVDAVREAIVPLAGPDAVRGTGYPARAARTGLSGPRTNVAHPPSAGDSAHPRAGVPHPEQLLEALLATATLGRGLVAPARIVLAGRPNVGKSTLANALLRFERMIVHATPGTTRDVVEETVSIRGVPFLLVDMAGMHEAPGVIERDGVDRARDQVGRADVVVAVLDGSAPLTAEDDSLLEDARARRAVVAINKGDLPQLVSPASVAEGTGQACVVISATKSEGLDELEQAIVDVAYPLRPARGEAVVFTERQERHLRAALEAVKRRDAHQALTCLGFVHAEPDA